MPFFQPDATLARIGTLIRAHAEAVFARHGVPSNQFAFVLLQPRAAGEPPAGFALRENWPSYPCSLVKVFFLVAVQHWLEQGLLHEHEELERAQHDMIQFSSNSATNYIIDLLTETTGDTLLSEAELPAWLKSRQTVNQFFKSLGWPELDKLNLDQKLMDDRRYGRERVGLDHSPVGHNRLTPIAAARLLHEIFHGDLLPPSRKSKAQAILARDPESPLRKRGAYQLHGYLGQGLPGGSQIWSKAGRTRWLGDSQAEFRRHDMLRAILPNGREFELTVFSLGEAITEDDEFLPAIGALAARELLSL